MRPRIAYRLFCILSAAASLWLPAGSAGGTGPAPVLTQRNDNARTGAYLSETALNTANVNAGQFGKLFARAVDGQLYAQPLYVPGLAVHGQSHNVILAATMHDSVYAFDADDPAAAAPLWQVNLGAPAPITYTLPNSTTIGHDFGYPGYPDISIEVGIVSTPVIDPDANTLYVVALTREPNPPACPCQYAHRLHALDLATGTEKFGGPVVISGTVPGAAEEGENGQVAFQSRQQLQRAGLLLQDGVVYIAFAGYGDWPPYHGWLFGYQAATLQQLSIWNASPNSDGTGIWQAGQGPAADANGQIYVMTGNGTYDPGSRAYGDSFVKLNPQAVISGGLPVVDTFTPKDQAFMEQHDADLGSGGPVLISGTQLLLGSGKTGKLYLLNQNDLGGFQEGPDGDDRVVQAVPTRFADVNPLRGAPVFWNSPSGRRFYQWGAGVGLKAYSLTISSAVSATIQTTPVATSTAQALAALPGGFLSLSADGSTAGSGIVWAVRPVTDGIDNAAQGILYAFDAANVANELWNSQQAAARDAVGNFAKFNAPTIANGRVYQATFSKQIAVYGLLGAPNILTQPLSQTVLGGQSPTLAVVVSGKGPLTYQWYQGASGDTHNPVGINSASYTPSALAVPANYWVRASNELGQADSQAAVIALANPVFLPVVGR